MDHPVAFVQGIYFLVTGIWPIISMSTFLKVTGPKTDLWLVKTVGIVLGVIGGVLIFAAINGQVNSALALLGIGSALGLIIVELVYVARQVISPIYLGDALLELILIGWWVVDIFLLKNRIS